jgi:hypothetical protein
VDGRGDAWGRVADQPADQALWLRDEFMLDDSEPTFREGSGWSTALLSSVVVERPGQRG